ncbi:MAG: carbohydrate-binding family 9-like protein [Candidatus Poribacteria bacterium]|nr:carbohydrate-binding family 9-like protein [Candidatus Poribacteria bacterium]
MSHALGIVARLAVGIAARADGLPKEPLSIVCPRLPASVPLPVIDGDLSDPAWSHAVHAPLLNTATTQSPVLPTRLSLLWDDANLYAAFDCADDGNVNATMTQHDANLWEEEVVELFIDTDGNLRTYYEFQVNPLNTFFDAYLINSGSKRWLLRDLDLDEIEHAVATHEKGWRVEMKMPFEEFGECPRIPPVVGDKWRVNFYRIDRNDPKRPELTSWSPTWNRNYHRTEAFGTLVFGD